MASSLPHSTGSSLSISPSLKSSFRHRVAIRARRLRDDEGWSPSGDVVDENLGILRRRIEEAKAKERLEQCRRYEIGWDYDNYNSDIRERPQNAGMTEGIELAFLVLGNLGLTLVGGTLLLCLTSLFIHLCLTR